MIYNILYLHMNSVFIAIETQALLLSIDFLTLDTAPAHHPSLSVSQMDNSLKKNCTIFPVYVSSLLEQMNFLSWKS